MGRILHCFANISLQIFELILKFVRVFKKLNGSQKRPPKLGHNLQWSYISSVLALKWCEVEAATSKHIIVFVKAFHDMCLPFYPRHKKSEQKWNHEEMILMSLVSTCHYSSLMLSKVTHISMLIEIVYIVECTVQ